MDAKLVMTVKEMENEGAWLEARNSGIGGSEASVVVGLNRYKTPHALWLEKTGQVEREDLSENQYIYWGKAIEPLIASWFEEMTGKKVRRAGLMRSEKFPFMLASVDRLVVGEDAGLEIKTASGFKAKEWEDDQLPDEYYIQCQHYMAVTGLKKWYIAVLLGGNKAIFKEVPRNDEDIEALIDAEKTFWEMVTNRVEPLLEAGDKEKELAERFKGGNKEPLMLNDEAGEVACKYLELKNKIEEDEKALKDLACRLKEELGDHELALAGDCEIKWSTVKGRVSLDSKKLKAEQPEIFAAYSKQGADTRRFAVSLIG